MQNLFKKKFKKQHLPKFANDSFSLAFRPMFRSIYVRKLLFRRLIVPIPAKKNEWRKKKKKKVPNQHLTNYLINLIN